MAELRCQGVAKSFGTRTVLHDVDLEVPSGTLTAILGASGSGKTTLLRVIVGFIALDQGTVWVGDSVVSAGDRKPMPPDKRAIGYVAQEGALFPHLSVAENVGFGLPRRNRKDSHRIIEALELVGLDEAYVDRRPHELSGGEQRRVGLARALAPRPRLVLLDEPFSGLDASLRTATREAVLNALSAEGSTAVMVTHDQAEALSMGREVAVLRDGRLVQTAAPTVLYGAPADLELARFVGEAVVLDGQARGQTAICALGELRVRGAGLTGRVDVMVRPEQVRLMDPAVAAAPRTHGQPAQVLSSSCFGPDNVIQLVLLDPRKTLITARTFDHDVPEPGTIVEVSVVGPVMTYRQQPQADSGDPRAAGPSLPRGDRALAPEGRA